MEKITDKQVKKVEVIFDCSEFSSDTYMVKGFLIQLPVNTGNGL